MRFARAAAVAALAACVSGTAYAGDPPRRTIDKSIEKAAARIAAEKLGQLRGLIFEDVNLDYLATGEVGAETQKSPHRIAPPPKGSGNSAKTRKLPPIVHNDRESHALDPFSTRSIIRTEDGRERVSMIFSAPVVRRVSLEEPARLD